MESEPMPASGAPEPVDSVLMPTEVDAPAGMLTGCGLEPTGLASRLPRLPEIAAVRSMGDGRDGPIETMGEPLDEPNENRDADGGPGGASGAASKESEPTGVPDADESAPDSHRLDVRGMDAGESGPGGGDDFLGSNAFPFGYREAARTDSEARQMPGRDFIFWPEAEPAAGSLPALTVEAVTALGPTSESVSNDHPAPFDPPAETREEDAIPMSGVSPSVFDDISRELIEFEAARPSAPDRDPESFFGEADAGGSTFPTPDEIWEMAARLDDLAGAARAPAWEAPEVSSQPDNPPELPDFAPIDDRVVSVDVAPTVGALPVEFGSKVEPPDEPPPPLPDVPVVDSVESESARVPTLLISPAAVADFVAARPPDEPELPRAKEADVLPSAPFARLSPHQPDAQPVSSPPPPFEPLVEEAPMKAAPPPVSLPPPSVEPVVEEAPMKAATRPVAALVPTARRAVRMSSRRVRIAAWLFVAAALVAAFATGWIFRAQLEPLLTAEYWRKLAGRSGRESAPELSVRPVATAQVPAASPSNLTDHAVPARETADTSNPPTAIDDKPAVATADNTAAVPPSINNPAAMPNESGSDVGAATPVGDTARDEPAREIRTDLDASLKLTEPAPPMEVRAPGEGTAASTGADPLSTGSPANEGATAAPAGVTPTDPIIPPSESSLLSGETGPILAAASPADNGPSVSDPDGLDVEVIKAQNAVRALIAASDVETIVPLIFAGEDFREALKSYHQTRPLRPMRDAVIERHFDGKVPETGARAFIFSVVHPSHPRGFPVSAEATAEGYKIDWESYIQWRDEWLRGFIENRPAGPFPLFVVLRRTHYFNDDVPQLDDKIAFKVASAIPGDSGTAAFAEKTSTAGRALAESYEWGKIYFPVVELEWVSEAGSSQYVRLNKVVRPTWRRAVTH